MARFSRGLPGCMTPLGLLAAFVALVGVAGITLARGGVLFSPGPLNAQVGEPLGGVRSHAELSNRCGACHPPFWTGEHMDDRCLQCHTTVGQELGDPATLHGGLFARNATLTCRTCHPEHKGPQASLTVMDPAMFPHEITGFSLQAHQKHADGTPFQCQDCHDKDIRLFNMATCSTCHQRLDAGFMRTHMADYGLRCLDCHDGVDRLGKNFDHNTLAFPLEGQHARVACRQCHAGARSLAAFRQTPQACYACHRENDVHAGAMGTQCEICHNPTSWETLTVDHNRTAFPLTGAHVSVSCEKCHVNNRFKGTPTACAACHPEPDVHRGMFGTECAMCHTTSAWRPATFNGEHTFPLNHGGARSRCALCHPNTLTEYTCYGCHEHNPTKIRREHLEEGIRNFENCVECHPTGREHERGREGGED